MARQPKASGRVSRGGGQPAAQPGTLNLPEALQRLAEVLTEQGLAVQVRLEGSTSFTPDQAGAFYCPARECLRNITMHSGSRAAELYPGRARTLLLIRNNGRGFNPDVEHPEETSSIRTGRGFGS